MAAKAKELHANPLTAPPKPPPRAGVVPLWQVWRWSLAHPGVSPWQEDGDAAPQS